ncbi:MAG: hypothetical protein CMJ25_06860 [Phycisphaerae bacterium]|nr:hypothetical protein [Phycisphaerae bacterium]|tara:strand:+ start:51 stop:1544 length:1494 start_codon:yes stop_codon:yes gene_type:complete
MTEHIGYIKDVQAGGSTKMLRLAAENYTEKTIVFITDTSDVQTDQVETRAIHDHGIPKEYIHTKKDEINKAGGIINSGLIITNKHKASLEATWSALPKDPNKVTIIWDEADYDAPGHDSSRGKQVAKHEHLNKLAKHASEIHYVSATVAGLVISDIVFTRIEFIENGEDYLSFSDCTLVNLGDEDVQEMLKTGEMSPTLKNFIVEYAHEGIFIRACKQVADMTAIVESIKTLDLGVDVGTLNGDTKNSIDPKTFKGILNSFQMGARGVSFPNLKHTIQDYAETTPQPVIVQSLRNLGYGKKLKKNFILANTSSLSLLEEAFAVEDRMKKILAKYPKDPEKRKEEVRKMRLDKNLCILPKNKGNSFKKQTSRDRFDIKTQIPYTRDLEKALQASGQLLVSIEEADNSQYLRWGGRSFDRVVRDLLNQPPNSPVWLERRDLQYVSPMLSIKRLVSAKVLAESSECWGFLLDENTGNPTHIALFELFEKPQISYSFTDQT